MAPKGLHVIKLAKRFSRRKLVIFILLFIIIYLLVSTDILASFFWPNIINKPDTQIGIQMKSQRTYDENGKLIYYHLPDLNENYFQNYYEKISTGKYCSKQGTDFLYSFATCNCIDGYYGSDCGIGPAVWQSLSDKNNISLMKKPKRIVLSVIFYPSSNLEDLIRFVNSSMMQLSDLVDLFIISEIVIKSSTVKNQSDFEVRNNLSVISPKMELTSLNHAFEHGPLAQYSDLVILQPIKVNQSDFSHMNFAKLESFVYESLWSISIKRLTDFRHNDVLIYMDWNTIPSREIMNFLKFYHGFTEPIKLIASLTEKQTQNISLSEEFFQFLDVSNQNYATNIALSFEYINLLCRYDYNEFVKTQCLKEEHYVKKFISTYWSINMWTIMDNNIPPTNICLDCQINLIDTINKSNFK